MTAPWCIRIATPADEALHRQFFAASRTDFDMLAPDVQSLIIEQQSATQLAYFRRIYPDLLIELAELEGAAVARMMSVELPEMVLIIDLVVLPEARRRGLAGELMRAAHRRATGLALPVRSSVELQNVASHVLHETLGYRRISEGSHYVEYEWRPALASALTTNVRPVDDGGVNRANPCEPAAQRGTARTEPALSLGEAEQT